MSQYDQGHTGRGQVLVNPFDSSDAHGTLFGHRVWRVGDEGWLTGDYIQAKWVPGVNEARCYQTTMVHDGHQPVFQDGSRGPAYDFSSVEPALRDGWEPAPCPGVARDDHGCGFYVRTGATYNSRFSHVRGVCEAWGQVELGTRGFRASKARIVALLKPDMGVRARTSFAVRQAEIRALRGVLKGMESMWLDEEGVRRMEQIEGEMETKRRINEQMTRAVKSWPLILKRYPDVEVFKTQDEMLRAYPPTGLTSLLEEAS